MCRCHGWISCEHCDSCYIGQTGRTLEHRIKEHRRAYTQADSFNSAVAEHSMETMHKINWDGAEVIALCDKQHQRCLIESWNIRTLGSTMNRDSGILPEIYNSLIHR